MQSATEIYNKMLGVILALTTVLIPIGFTIVVNTLGGFSQRLESVNNTAHEIQKNQAVNKISLELMKEKITGLEQKKTP